MSARALRAGKAFIEMALEDRGVQTGLRKIERRFDMMGRTLQGYGAAAIGLGGSVLAAFVPTINAASDLEETMNKFNVVFGKNSEAVKAWGDQFASTVGRSEEQIARFLSNTQDLLVPIGFEAGAATEMSKQITSLAVDLASFNNMQDADVVRDLHAALTGSGEVMKKYGVIVSQAAVNQELLNSGLDPKSATEQEKAQARLAIIMAGTTSAQGDAIRSAGSYANQSKALYAALSDLAAVVGQAVLPAVTQVVSKLIEVARGAADWAKDNQELVIGLGVAGATITALGAGLLTLGTVLSAASAAVGVFTAVAGTIVAIVSSPIVVIGALATGLAVLADKLLFGGRAMKTLSNIAGKVFKKIADSAGKMVKKVIKSIGKFAARMLGFSQDNGLSELNKELEKTSKLTSQLEGVGIEAGAAGPDTLTSRAQAADLKAAHEASAAQQEAAAKLAASLEGSLQDAAQLTQQPIGIDRDLAREVAVVSMDELVAISRASLSKLEQIARQRQPQATFQ